LQTKLGGRETAAIKGSKKPALNEQKGPSRLKRDLMLFWGMHTTGRFDEKTICYALDYDLRQLEKELSLLVDTGIVEKETENGASLYWLTLNENKRRCIVEWASPGHSGR
jgi:hypothetical protein